MVRLRRIRPQAHGFLQLRNRFGTVARLRQHAAQEQSGVGIARVGPDDVPQDANRLIPLSRGKQVPRQVDRLPLCRQQEG